MIGRRHGNPSLFWGDGDSLLLAAGDAPNSTFSFLSPCVLSLTGLFLSFTFNLLWLFRFARHHLPFPLFSNHGTWARRTHWKPSPVFFFFLFTPIWSRKKQKNIHTEIEKKNNFVSAAENSSNRNSEPPKCPIAFTLAGPVLFSFIIIIISFSLSKASSVCVCVSILYGAQQDRTHLTLPRKSPLFSFTPYRRPTGWREVTTQKGRIKILKGSESRWTFCVWELIAVDRRNQFGFGWIFRIEIQWVNRVRCQMLTILIRLFWFLIFDWIFSPLLVRISTLIFSGRWRSIHRPRLLFVERFIYFFCWVPPFRIFCIFKGERRPFDKSVRNHNAQPTRTAPHHFGKMDRVI